MPVLVLLVFVTLNSVYAVPGLERTWKSMHPEAEVSCTLCHQRTNGELPTYENVTAEGRKKYEEILTKRKAGIPKFKIHRPLPKADFVVMGDSRTDIDTNREVVKQICADNPKAVFHTGDMVADGKKSSQWQEVLPVYECLLKDKRLFPSCGNHEGSGCTNNIIRKTLGNDEAYYTTELGGFTFIALDSNNVTGEELQWLSHLPPNKKYIPFFHHPAFPLIAGHGPDKTVLKEFIPRFKKLGIKLVFTGHNHGYDRTIEDGIMYITSGGSGAPLYPCGTPLREDQVCVSDYHYLRCAINGSKIACQAKLLDGMIVDSISVDYGPQRADQGKKVDTQ